MAGVEELRARLRSALHTALKARDASAVAALRSALGAIANAEAIETAHASSPVLGVGAADVARRELSMADVTEILRAEITDRVSAADEYERLGRPEQARRLRAEAAVIQLELSIPGSPDRRTD